MKNLDRVNTEKWRKRVSGITISRDNFVFSAAHFAQFADGTSERLHGHNYSVCVEVSGELDSFGYIVDFMHLKQSVLKITGQLNHKVLIPSDSVRLSIKCKNGEFEIIVDKKRYVFPASDVALLPIKNTTCEELSAYILATLLSIIECHLAGLDCHLIKVQVMEGPNQGAFCSWGRFDD